MKSSVINIFASFTSILPGDLTDCLDPTNVTDPSCGDCLASVASVMRHSKTRGDGPSFYFPYLDRESKFVQMHPEGWGVNRLVSHDYFGWDRFFAWTSLFTDENRLSWTNLLSQNFCPMIRLPVGSALRRNLISRSAGSQKLVDTPLDCS